MTRSISVGMTSTNGASKNISLHGSDDWRIENGMLTVRRDGVPTLVVPAGKWEYVYRGNMLGGGTVLLADDA